MFEKFKEVYEKRHEYAKDWKTKNKGKKVMGYFCTYAPEELMYAGGIMPVRVLGSHEPQDVTEPHIFGMYCPFCRDVLAQGLKGRYDYLDGIMIAQSCLHVRQAYTSWDLHKNPGYSYFLPMPHHVQSPRSRDFLAEELKTFKGSLEKWLGQGIGDKAIADAIAEYNKNRQLMKKVYELRKGPNPPMTGVEVMYMVAAGQMMDKKDHNKLLEELLKGLPNRKMERKTGERLMILGSENDDIAFMNMVEGCGATFVVDDHCTGTRYFWNEVRPGGDPLAALANRYVDRTPCPTKDWPQRKRIETILKFAKEYKVQGAIIIQQKFCDPHELDIPAIRKALEGAGLKVLFLELDVTVPVGQFRIRVEAFLEMMRQEDLF